MLKLNLLNYLLFAFNKIAFLSCKLKYAKLLNYKIFKLLNPNTKTYVLPELHHK